MNPHFAIEVTEKNYDLVSELVNDHSTTPDDIKYDSQHMLLNNYRVFCIVESMGNENIFVCCISEPYFEINWNCIGEKSSTELFEVDQKI